MKTKVLIALLTSSALFSGCAQMKVSSESDPAYRHSGIKTYQWTTPPAELFEQDEFCQALELQKALNNELAALGWKQVLDPAEASAQVAYSINLQSHREFCEPVPGTDHGFSGGLVFNRNEGKWNYEEHEPDRVEYTVESGTFHFLVIDTGSGKRVWHGTVETKVDRSRPADEQDEHFRQIARKLGEKLAADLR